MYAMVVKTSGNTAIEINMISNLVLNFITGLRPFLHDTYTVYHT